MNLKNITFIHFIIIMLLAGCAREVEKEVITSKNEPVKKITPADKPLQIHYGKALITEIAVSGDNSLNDKKGYMQIYFSYTPDDPGTVKKYLCTECPDTHIKLVYDNRDSFHINWIKKWEIKEGNGYSAIRREELKDGKADVSYEVFLDQKK